MSSKGQSNNSKTKQEDSLKNNSNLSNLNNFLQSKKGKNSLVSALVLSALLLSGLFTYNLLKQNGDTAKAASTAAAAFNPSDCATYVSNGGTNTAGVCFVKLYEKNGNLFQSLDIAPGELVNVRNYYNNTTTSSVTAANITDSIPTSFTKVGNVTNNYVDAAPVTLNNNLFTGQNLSVAPGAGYFGYAPDSSVTSSNLELGKKRYLIVDQCNYTDTLNADNYSTRNIRFSPILTTTTTCNPSAQISYNQVATLSTAGNRYIIQGQCNYYNPTDDDNYSYRDVWAYDNTLATTVTCASVSPNIAQYLTNITSSVNDSLGGRYLHQNQCNYSRTRPNATIDTYTFYDIISINNTLNAAATCTQNAELVNATVGTIDTSDTTRGYGYISYSMQAPTTGLTNGQTVGTTGTLAANGNQTSGTASSLTITNVPTPNISYNKLYSIDGGTTWSPTVTANPGQSVMVRLWNENTGGISSTNANIKDSLPNTFTYVPGSTRNCLNPSTVTITTPDNAELVCDSGSAANKDSLFQTLTNASGVSPSAGLYDAAGTTVSSGGTSFSAVAGVKEIGKKRYIAQLRFANGSNTETAINYDTTSMPWPATNIYTTPSNSPQAANDIFPNWKNSCNSGAFTGCELRNFDIFSKRYIAELRFLNGTNTETAINYSTASAIWPAANIYTTASNVPQTSTDMFSNWQTQCNSGSWTGCELRNFDLFSKRYITELRFSNAGNTETAINYDTSSTPWPATNIYKTPSNRPLNSTDIFPTWQTACNNGTFTGCELRNFDLLSPTRSKSYIQYEMIIPSGTAGGNYGTQSTISSSATTPEFTSVTSGTDGSGITVTGDPAFSVKKLLALPTSGTGVAAVCPTSISSYSTTLSNTVPGSTVCVRLAYQNKTAGAVANAAITDTLSSGFTYINNTTTNCLTPVVGNEVCAADASQASSAWTGNNGWSGNNFALAPHAGLYGQVASGTGSTASVMEMGKKRYINQIGCGFQSTSNVDYFNYSPLIAANNLSTQTADCNPLVPSGYSLSGAATNGIIKQDILGNRYINQIGCGFQSTSNVDYFNYSPLIAANNLSTQTADCNPLVPSGYSLSGAATNGIIKQDILGNRYINQIGCGFQSTSNVDYFNYSPLIAANNLSTQTADCNPLVPSGYSLSGAATNGIIKQDLLDPANGTGYIQYKMTSPTNPTTSSVTLPNVTLAGDNQTTSTSPATINFSTSPLTTADVPSLNPTCGVGSQTPGTVMASTTTTCTFTLPPNKTLPTDPNNLLKLGIGNSTPAGTCTTGTGTNSNLVTCTEVPTGTLTGTQPINGQIGSGVVTPTAATVNVVAQPCSVSQPCALFESALTYSPIQTLAKRYGGSGSTQSADLILTLKDTRLETVGYTTTCTIKYKFKIGIGSNPPAYTTLADNVAYNNTTGCTGTLAKANQTLFNVDFEITAVSSNTAVPTSPVVRNFLLYANYDFKAGSIGVTSIGGSGL